ncbi:unnamed protein product, partial [Laminaria digitata]
AIGTKQSSASSVCCRFPAYPSVESCVCVFFIFDICFGLPCFARMPASACACCLRLLLLQSEFFFCLRTAENYRKVLRKFSEFSRNVLGAFLFVMRAFRAFLRTLVRDLSEIFDTWLVDFSCFGASAVRMFFFSLRRRKILRK